VAVKTTVHGAFPKPQPLLRARWLYAEEEIDADLLQKAQHEATAGFLGLQKELGVTLRTDGQMDRDDMISFLADRVHGLQRGGLVRVLGNRYYRRPIVDDALKSDEPLTVDAWQSANRDAGDTPLKAVLTGPYTLMHWSSNEHYPDRKSCASGFADVICEEAGRLVAAGVRDLQIDEPAAGVYSGEIDCVLEGVRRVADAIGDDCRLWLQLAYGDYAELLQRIGEVSIHGLSLEMANNRMATLDVLSGLPGSLQIAAGVVDAQNEQIESVDTLVERAKKVAAITGEDRLWLAPDAGLRYLSPDVATSKLRNLAAAAQAI